MKVRRGSLFTQGFQPCPDDLVICAARAEPERAGGCTCFQSSGKAAQFVQKLLVGAERGGLLHLAGQFRKLDLETPDIRLKSGCLEQAQHGQRSIGFDLEKPLDNGAGLNVAQGPVADQEPCKTIAILPEVGRDHGSAVFKVGNRQAGFIELASPFLAFITAAQFQPDGDQQIAGRPKRSAKGVLDRHLPENRLFVGATIPGVGGEFRVLFPAQGAAAEIDGVMTGSGRRTVATAGNAEL